MKDGRYILMSTIYYNNCVPLFVHIYFTPRMLIPISLYGNKINTACFTSSIDNIVQRHCSFQPVEEPA